MRLVWIAATISIPMGCQRQAPPPARPSVPPPPSLVVGVTPERVVEKTVELPATIQSFERAELMPKIEAYVERVLVDIGDEVESGQPLVQLAAPEIEQQVVQRRREIEQISAQRHVYAAELSAAQAELQRVEAQSELRGSERDRLSRLVSSGAIGSQRLEEAQFAAQSADADIARFQNAVRIAEARIAQGESSLAVAEAALAEVQALAGYLSINAPFSGVVTKRNVDPGNLVRPDSDAGPLLVVATVDRLRAVMHAATDVAAQLAVGQIVRFTPDDSPDAAFEAPIARLAGSYDPRTRMMRVEVDYENRRDEQSGRRTLRAGAYGRAQIVIASTGQQVPAVPSEAIIRRGEQSLVVVVENGRCFRAPVQLGLKGDDLTAVAAGLQAGVQIVASSPELIKDDQGVTPDQVKPASW